eukprot:CAMPEP_0184548398 /NCGR_PEP_ID=MMETSP0199_2-20130426/6179_1 /TAXON_ID=1112570 /ORGANISM="Thraustochytrium sp., Strain LLF1b" /LENGTH=1031 /DNA_ID=CAMNT_0026943009 /DNA_START=176 /DNA_END=3269 /DNA_ORIENTATION=+
MKWPGRARGPLEGKDRRLSAREKLVCAARGLPVAEAGQERVGKNDVFVPPGHGAVLQDEVGVNEVAADGRRGSRRSIVAAHEPVTEESSKVEQNRVKRLSQRMKSMISGASSNSAQGFADAIERISPAVVVIRTNFVRTLEGSAAGSSTATGFIVDKRRGIMLTNRHVMSTGPVRAMATFINKEEIELEPLYADPVHDFAFFRFNPSDVKYIPLAEIQLSPERAKVGLEIRVVGNDAGEQLQILGGTLARLDRDAPVYSNGVYRDFNTFYYSAASSTSGGSSGSPVIDNQGRAVALNAGARLGTASSYYLPLHRVVRALGFVQNGEQVPRRTLQCVFGHTAFAEAQRLGLPESIQANVRKTFPTATGVLVVQIVVPGGPADTVGLQTGDILLKLDGQLIHEFLPLETALDDNKEISLTLQRGEATIEVTTETDDLHSLMLSEYVEISDGIVHPMSYHGAIKTLLPVGCPVVSTSGYMLRQAQVAAGFVFISVDNEPTPDLASFAAAICKYPESAKVALRIKHMYARFREYVVSATIERTWFVWRHAERVLKNGAISWKYTDLPGPSIEYEPPLQNVRFSSNEEAYFVEVSFTSPFFIEGLSSMAWFGFGAILDWKEGLIVCDRATVPHALGNVSITVAGTFEVPASVIFVHPMYDFALVRFDPKQIKAEFDDNVTQTQIEPSSKPVHPGDEVTFMGLTDQSEIVKQRCTVTTVARNLSLPKQPPQFTGCNQLVIKVDKVMSSIGGVLTDDIGKVQALWFAEGFGVPIHIFYDAINPFKKSLKRSLSIYRSLALDLYVVRVAEANAAMGLTDRWIKDLSMTEHHDKFVFSVRNVMANSNSSHLIESGDILLAVEDQPVTQTHQIDKLVGGKEEVSVTVLRNQEEKTIVVPTTPMPCIGTTRVVLFAGMTLQAPHPEVAMAGYLPDELAGGAEGVYCSFWYFGSPADLYGMQATSFIVAVNEIPTPTLDDFLTAVSTIPDNVFMRIKYVSLSGKPSVATLKNDRFYWPTTELRRDPDSQSWNLEVLDAVAMRN